MWGNLSGGAKGWAGLCPEISEGERVTGTRSAELCGGFAPRRGPCLSRHVPKNPPKKTSDQGGSERNTKFEAIPAAPRDSAARPSGPVTSPSAALRRAREPGAGAAAERSGAVGRERPCAVSAPAAAERSAGSGAMGRGTAGGPRATAPGQQLRALFYVLPPGESSFRTVEEVPDYVEKVRVPLAPRRPPSLSPPPTLRAAAACPSSKAAAGPRTRSPRKGTYSEIKCLVFL